MKKKTQRRGSKFMNFHVFIQWVSDLSEVTKQILSCTSDFKKFSVYIKHFLFI